MTFSLTEPKKIKLSSCLMHEMYLKKEDKAADVTKPAKTQYIAWLTLQNTK